MHHLNIFFVVTGAIGILLPAVAPSNDPRIERRLFWAGFLTTSISGFFIAYPPDWKAGVGWALLAGFTMIVRAYFSTSYIKIRGKIYAFHIADSQPDPSPDGTPASGNDDPGSYLPSDAYRALGGTTAGKMWWLIVFLMGGSAFNVVAYFHFRENVWVLPLSAAFIVVGGAIFGYAVDASPGYPIARGQYLQFAIVSIATAGVFTISYLGGYYAGKRWPWDNKRSLEYGAHSRHQKRWP